jgi:hypothetical protein
MIIPNSIAIEISNIIINFRILCKITLKIYFLDYKLTTINKIINNIFNKTNIVITDINKHF